MPDSSTATHEPEPRYIAVEGVHYEPAAGCARTFSKHLLSTERLDLKQTVIRGQGVAEDYGTCARTRAAYILSGSARLEREGAEATPLVQGHLVVIPAGARWGQRVSLLSDELVLLEISEVIHDDAVASVAARPEVQVIDPKDVRVYEPAGHAKTQNRCLFVDEHMEIIEGRIERGGGAERHAHSANEQLLYVLSGAGVPLLIYYPKGAPHGTGGGVADPLQLLVIYSPPLGEAHNALA